MTLLANLLSMSGVELNPGPLKGNSMVLLEDEVTTKDLEIQQLRAQINELQSQVQARDVENLKLRNKVSTLKKQLHKKKVKEVNLSHTKLNNTVIRIKERNETEDEVHQMKLKRQGLISLPTEPEGTILETVSLKISHHTDQPNVTHTEYEKRAESTNMAGELYEVKMSALLFLRALREKHPFLLACNMKAAGDFDDVIYSQGDQVLLMQLKHRQSCRRLIQTTQLMQNKGDFSLLKYHKSYCKVRDQWAHSKDLQLLGKFEDFVFIVYTTARMSEKVGVEVTCPSVVSCGGKCFSFNKDSPVVKQFLSLDGFPDFLHQTLFFTEQASEKDLDQLIEKELVFLCGTNKVHARFVEDIQNWWRSSSYFLTETSTFWQNTICNMIAQVSAKMLKQLNDIYLRYEKDILKQLRAVLDDREFLHIVSTNTVLTALKLHQSLGITHHLLVDSSTLQSCYNEVSALWGRWCELLVVVEDNYTLTESVQCGRRLIHISCSAPTNPCFTLSDETNFEQFDATSRQRVLAAMVDFQGYNVPLGSITGGKLDLVPCNEVVKALTGKLVLGQCLTGELDYYVPRTLEFHCFIKTDILLHPSQRLLGTLALSGLTCEEVKRLAPTMNNVQVFGAHKPSPQRDGISWEVILVSSEEEFLKLAESRGKLHWLHWKDNVFLWLASRSNVDILQTYLDDSVMSTKNIDCVKDVPYRTAVVSAEPGMGKSTLLTHLALGTKQKFPATWIIRVNLNDVTQKLHKMPHNMTIKCVTEFLLEVSGMTTQWMPLFWWKLLTMDNICVLFDGYDEISPTHTDTVAQMLQILKAKNLQALWVTTRPVLREILETELCTLTFQLQPFLESAQKQFLYKFWSGRIASIDKLKLEKFTSELLRLTELNLKDRHRKFMGIPLQSMLLAEAFEDNLRQYNEGGKLVIPHNFDLLYLYERFISRKLEIYYGKNQMDTTKPDLLEYCGRTKIKFEQNHKILALFLLVPTDNLKRFQAYNSMKVSYDKFILRVKQGKEKTGIINQIVNDLPMFVHRTFAEYFAATWFANNFKHARQFLRGILFDPSFQVVRNFFDRILACKYPLHTAILNQDVSLIERLVLEKELDVNTKDDGGRTPLHLAVISYIDNSNNTGKSNRSILDSSPSLAHQIVMFLLEQGADPGISDHVLNWRPLYIADKISAWTAIGSLMEKNADKNDLIQTALKMNDNCTNLLAIVAKHGFVNLMSFMLLCCIPLLKPFNASGIITDVSGTSTILHEAAQRGDMKMLKFLISKNVDIEAHDNYVCKCTALIKAAANNHLEIIKLLLAGGASIDAREKDQNTALLTAARKGNLDAFRLLTQHKADISAHNIRGDGVMHLVAESGNVEFMMYLLETKSYEVDCRNARHCTPLWFAARHGDFRMTKLLCEHGADVHNKDLDWEFTPLHVAARWGHLQVALYLVQQGASLTTQCKQGYTPSAVAEQHRHQQMFQKLQGMMTHYICMTKGYKTLTM